MHNCEYKLPLGDRTADLNCIKINRLMLCTKRNHNKDFEWVCLNSTCPYKGLMCSQCLMDTFQGHKHDAPEIIGYKIFLDGAETCLKEYHTQIHSSQSKSQDILQHLVDENKSKLSVTKAKVFEVVEDCFASLLEEVTSIEKSFKVQSASDTGLITRLQGLIQSLGTKQTDKLHAENDISFISSYLLRDPKQSTFRINTERIKKPVNSKSNEKDLRPLRDRCDELRKTITLVGNWAQKLKKNVEGNKSTDITTGVRVAFSPAKTKTTSGTRKQSTPRRKQTKKAADPSTTDQENGDVIRKRLHMGEDKDEDIPISKKAMEVEPVPGINLGRSSRENALSLDKLRENIPPSPPRRRSPKRRDEAPLSDRLGPFSFLDSAQPPKLQPRREKSVLSAMSEDDNMSLNPPIKKPPVQSSVHPTQSSVQSLPPHAISNNSSSHSNKVLPADYSSSAKPNAPAGLQLVRRFETDKSMQPIHYLESQAITFSCSRDLEILGFAHFQVAESQPNFVAHMEYKLLEGDGIDDDDELDKKVISLRTGNFQIKRDPGYRVTRILFDKPTRLLRGKYYTISVTSKCKIKFSCWEGKGGKEQNGPFRFRRTRDTHFYRLTTNVQNGQIPELVYTF